MATKDIGKRIIIVGGGIAGKETLQAIQQKRHGSMSVIGIVDDNPKEARKTIRSKVPVLGTINELPQVLRKHPADEILIAIPSAQGGLIRRIIENCNDAHITFRIVPRVLDIVEGTVQIERVREVRSEDLLGRALVKSDQRILRTFFRNNTVLVTGGAGSIGSELCHQIATLAPKRLVILDWWENGMYELGLQMKEVHPKLAVEMVIANVQDAKKIDAIMQRARPQFVFHAAAYKHVPLMEHHPEEALRNNVIGTWNVAKSAKKYGVKKFILISTDKAVRPTNVMGATKQLAETLVDSLNGGKTAFSSVRFGNVLASNGSVVPLFQKQIQKGGPVTITHPEVVRFFMSIPEAVQLILQAAHESRGKEIFVLDMGEPVKIIDLAKSLIRLSGLEPEQDIQIEYTGLRPGEKLYEEILTDQENVRATKKQGIYKAIKQTHPKLPADGCIRKAERLIAQGKRQPIVDFLKKNVIEYSPTTNGHTLAKS